ncbi:MADS-box transcription factor PHERES 1 [Morus notabilis]|uniref:MADS-box transcription factor PHERES 1 n=1 Tax=Morus notabilis TaxID=981085 RepID=W9SQ48_9ROSA|nr:MADS-box transcription factor PHERES 1 [Morus notabilis]
MGRGKLKLEFIRNEKVRKTTFLKRKKGILKKANEFSILCGIDICLFISGPKLDGDIGNNNSRPSPEFETWPPERTKVMSIINKYQATILRKPPKKVHGLKDTFVERKRKIEAEISRCRKKLCEAKYPTCLELIEHLPVDEMSELVHRLDGKTEAIQFVIEAKKENELNKKTNEALSLMNSNHYIDNNQVQLLLNEIPRQPGYSNCPMNISHPNMSNDMKYSTTVFKDPMAGIHFNNPTAEIQHMEAYMGYPHNYMQYSSSAKSALRGPVFGDPTAGMLMENMNVERMMTMFGNGGGSFGGGESSSVQMPAAQYYPLLQVQPPTTPYMQYPMNVLNLARRIGPMSQVMRSSSTGGRSQVLSEL